MFYYKIYLFMYFNLKYKCVWQGKGKKKKLFNSLVLPHACFKVRLSFDLSESNDTYFIF